MDTTQYQEALQFFRRGARDWKRAATAPQIYSIVRARQRLALSLLRESPEARLLDIGCGTGELVHAAARKGHFACGIDFSPEMILLARSNTPASAPKAPKFIQSSFLDWDPPEAAFGVVTANGFIEYISPTHLIRLFELAAKTLVVGGTLALHARNRLFNLISENAYTELEIALGTIPRLQAEASLFQSESRLVACLAQMEVLQGRLPVVKTHPHTGIGVHTRHQYTPSELLHLGKSHGLEAIALHPLHYHAFRPSVKGRYPRIHQAAALLAQRFFSGRQSLLPQSSSFLFVWRKRG